MSHIAIIVAAGNGRRAGSIPKQFYMLNDYSVLWYAVAPFLRHEMISEVRVIVADDDAAAEAKALLRGLAVTIMPKGGASRAQTVLNGFVDCADDCSILVHDAARPCLDDDLLERFLEQASDDPNGGILALPLADALKESADGRVLRALPRSNKWLAQTPQMFRAAPLRRALTQFPDAADEAEAMTMAGFSPLLVTGATKNIKITNAEDFATAALLVADRT